MRDDFIPGRDAEFRTFAADLSATVSAEAAQLGVPSLLATTLATQVSAFDAAFMAATNPASRGRATIKDKQDRRKTATATIREVVRIIKANPAVTANILYDMGLPARVGDTPRTTSQELEVAPVLAVKDVDGREVTVTITDPASPLKRARAKGATGAIVMWYAGTTAPTDTNQFHLAGTTGRTEFTVQLPEALAPGTRVWLTAMWIDGRKRPSPACQPIGTYVQFGGDLQMAA
jgi:hypothetical protein